MERAGRDATGATEARAEEATWVEVTGATGDCIGSIGYQIEWVAMGATGEGGGAEAMGAD